MSVVSLILIVLVAGLALFVVAAVIGQSNSKKAGGRAAELLNRIEQKYLEFTGQFQRDFVLDSDQDMHGYIEEVRILVKPELEALISLVNATTYSSVEVPFDSQIFPNLGSLAEESFRISQRNANKALRDEEEKDFYHSFEESVRADLSRRKLAYGPGNQQSNQF